MSSRRKSSTPCMVRPGSGPPEHPRPEVEQPTEEELVGEPVEDDVPKPLRSPDPGEENKGPPPQHQEEGCGAGPEGRPSSLGDPEALELSEQKREGPEGGAAEMDPEHEDEDEEEGEPGDSKTSTQKTRGYVCKYCSFSTHNLCDFKDHVDTRHPNVILNPLYRCAVCDFSTNRFDSLTDHNEAQHPGETNFKFKRVTTDHQTVLEQTIEGRGATGQEPPAPPHTSAALQKPGGDRPLHEDPKPHQEDQVTAMVNGAIVVPEPSSLQGPYMSPLLQGPHVSPLLQGPHMSPLLQGPYMSPLLQGPHVSPLLQGPHLSPLLQGPHLSPLLQGPHLSPLLQGPHVSPLLQRPPNFSSVPKIAVPLNTTRYNPSLDTNLTLMSSFNKFPYPTHAELSWLTAASKHPEEQIKVWFTAQRLKQGITWSPEEVEEARKKMFNGSIPPAHHTFTVPPVSPAPPCSAQSPQPGLRSRSSPSSGPLGPGSSPSGRVSVCSSYAVARPLAEPTECQRPIMAVAPHSGDRKDKGLMAPPPPPPPLKDRPPVPMEMKRPAATPLVTMDTKRKNLGVALMPPPPLSKGQVGAPGPPAGSRPPLVFPQTLARRYVAPPPPIIAPPYKNYRIPHPSALASQEKHLVPQDSRPPGPKRPSIIQPPRAGRHPAQHPALSSHSHKLKEQQGMELKAPSPRGDKVLTPLSEANGASRDLNLQHNGVLQANGGGSERQGALQKGPVPTQFPLLERMKGKTAEQLKVLEETFLRNSFPSHGDVDALAAASRLSRQEIKSWFLERRALRDNLEQALLNSMGSKKTGGLLGGPGARRQQTPQLNGVHKPRSTGGGGGHIRSPPPPPTSQVPSPIVAPPTPPPAPLLQDDGALSRWPSPEEMSQLETRTGLPRSDLLRWFTDSRLALKTSGSELTQLFHKMGGAGPIGGQQGGRANPLLDYAPNAIQRSREGAAKSNGIDTPEANASRIAENYASSLGSQQHQELQDWFSSRLRQQSSLEMKSGGGGGGAGGGAGEVLGSWMENGHMQHAQELSLEHPQKLEG